jgi:hypothetical protein
MMERTKWVLKSVEKELIQRNQMCPRVPVTEQWSECEWQQHPHLRIEARTEIEHDQLDFSY